MKITDLICPGCSAPMQMDLGKKKVFCEYCGRTMMITADDNLVDLEDQLIEDPVMREKTEWEERMRIAHEARRLEKERSVYNAGLAAQEERKEKNKHVDGIVFWALVIGLSLRFVTIIEVFYLLEKLFPGLNRVLGGF
ncbi:MAG: hypothetical protein J5825_11550 [Lachnospiraceae bacterium]|nr:hypothetical protein [Lachnospiraceae bacterium]